MRRVLTAFMLLGVMSLTVPGIHASLVGTVSLAPGGTVFPGLTSAPAGTLLANETISWTSTLGTSAGTLTSAVYRESGSNTLDFYYQVTNNATAPNCGTAGHPTCDPLSRETDTTFAGFITSVGYRIDGGSLTGAGFTNGTVVPVTADRNSPNGDVVGFSFNPPDSAKIQPGQTSTVLVISTNATQFMNGNASVIDGGVTTVASYEPAAPIPEPASLLLFAGGFIGLAALRRSSRRNIG